MSVLAKRALLAALTVIGLALLVGGAWFTVHLGTSGSATFRATPRTGVVVLGPSVLNRIHDPVSVKATAADGEQVWMGLATPSDATAVVGDAKHTTVTGVVVRSWTLDQVTSGLGPSVDTLPGADVWRREVIGKGTARLTVDQADAPEALVVSSPDGQGRIATVTLTVERRAWFFQSLLTALVGLLATVVGAVGLFSSGTLRPTTNADAAVPSTEVAA